MEQLVGISPANGSHNWRGKERVMKDRFTQAYKELEEKNCYVCETCTTTYGHPTIGHLSRDADGTGRSWGPEDILNADPMPFGD